MKNFRSRNTPFSPEAVTGILLFLIGLSGVLTILSSQSSAGEPWLLAGRQCCHLFLSLAAFFLAARIPFPLYRLAALPLSLFCMGLFWLLMVWGTRINGCCGWFRFGSFCFQPTEPAKGCFLLLLAVTYARLREEKWGLPAVLLLTFLWMLPIFCQPDLGMCCVYFAAFALVLFLGGLPWKQLGALAGLTLTAAALFIARHPYAVRRLTGFLSPETDPDGSGWHVRQFALTVARGGWGGSKLGGALWSNTYLPLPYNDSAFATMAETIGLAGMVVPFLFYVLLLFCVRKLFLKPDLAEDAKLYGLAAVYLTAFQALLHVSVNLCLLPPTGLTLPLVSYGGSSLLGSCLLFGIALSAGRCHKNQ